MERDLHKIGIRQLLKTSVFAFKRSWKLSQQLIAVYILNATFSAITPIAQAFIAGSIIGELALIASGEASQSKTLILVVAAVVIRLLSELQSRFLQHHIRTKEEFIRLGLTYEVMKIRTTMRLDLLELPEMTDRYQRADSGANMTIGYVSSLADLGGALLGIFGTLFVLVNTVPVAAAALAVVPVVSVWLNYRNFLIARRVWDERREHRVRGWYIEAIMSKESDLLELRLYGLIEKLLKLWRRESKKGVIIMQEDELRRAKSSLLISAMEMSVGVAVDIWLVFRVFAGAIAVGTFEQTRRLVSNYISSLSRISSVAYNQAEAIHKINDFYEFIHDESLIEKKLTGSLPGGTISSLALSGASYKYPNGTAPAVNNVSLQISTGQTVALVGENGAGKSTMLKLLLGMYEPSSGEALCNDRDFQTIPKQQAYAQTATLFQDFLEYDFLKLGQSVAIAGKKYDRAKVKEVLDIVGLREFVEAQPKGLDSNVGYVTDDGIKFSGGQWQRMAIARALYKDAELLVLDEPTSAIDAKSEQEIMDLIFERYKERMLIVVSHRLSTVQRADRIVMVKDGKIVEDGTHGELFKKGTAYYDLFHKQATRLKD